MISYAVKPDTLEHYMRTIVTISRIRPVASADILHQLDIRRQGLHDAILSQAGVTRDDGHFAFWLASLIEDHLQELNLL